MAQIPLEVEGSHILRVEGTQYIVSCQRSDECTRMKSSGLQASQISHTIKKTSVPVAPFVLNDIVCNSHSRMLMEDMKSQNLVVTVPYIK